MNAARVKATRNANTLRRGDEIVIDLDDQYWANELKAQNIEIIDQAEAVRVVEVATPASEVYDDALNWESLTAEMHGEAEEAASDDAVDEDPED